MAEENIRIHGPEPINGNLRVAVTELVKGLLPGAHGIVVVVHADGLHEVLGGMIMGLPVCFDPTVGFRDTVSIRYEYGNLEYLNNG